MKTLNKVEIFSNALEALKGGHKVTRISWNNKVHLELQVPDEHSKMTLPYIYMVKLREGYTDKFPCDLSCESILANDWTITK